MTATLAASTSVTHAADALTLELADMATALARLTAAGASPERLILEARGYVDALVGILADARGAVMNDGPAAGLYENIGGFEMTARVSAYVDAIALDVARLPRGATLDDVRQLVVGLDYPMRRIAVSEAYNAQRENQLSAMLRTRDVRACRWTTTSRLPCLICQTLARMDQYGLGAGVWPLTALPLVPHPFCKCVLEPVALDEQFTRVTGAIDVPDGLTRAQARALRSRVRDLLRQSRRAPQSKRLRRLVRRAS